MTPPLGLRGVEELLHDELLDSLPTDYDRDALMQAEHVTYIIHQVVSYEYTKPVKDLRQRLMILPRRLHGDQQRVLHRFDVRTREDAQVRTHTDRFGNSILDAIVPSVQRHIEFQTRAVITRSPRQPHRPAWKGGRPIMTRLTRPDDSIRDAAAELGPTGDVFETADSISDFVRRSFEYCHDVTSVRTTAAEAWQLRRGVCQDMAHVMIAMCSSLGIVSRYVSGHLVGDGASHAWVEVFDPNRQTVVAIDPTHQRRTDLRYITTATGRDYRDVAPTSGTYSADGGRGRLKARKTIRVAALGRAPLSSQPESA